MPNKRRICVYSDIASPQHADFEDKKSLYKHLERVFNNAYYSHLGRPVVTLVTRKINNVNGHITHVDTPPAMSIYISDTYTLSADGKPCVKNPRTGMVVQTSGGYVIMNHKMKQLYPVLEKNQRTALDEFVSASFSKCSDSKQKTK